MAKAGTFTQLKDVIYEMVDANGNMRAFPIGKLGKQMLSSDRIALIQLMIKLILDTDFIKPYTKMYLRQRGISVNRLHEDLVNANEINPEELNAKALSVRVYRDQEKFEKVIGSDFILDVCYGVGDISVYSARVAKAYASLVDNNLRESIALEIPKGVFQMRCDRAEFEEFVGVIIPYLKTHMESISNGLNANAVGYFNYLISCPDECLDDVAKMDKNYLVKLLKGDSEPVSYVEID